MRIFVTTGVFLLTIFCVNRLPAEVQADKPARFYRQAISVPKTMRPDLKAAVEDLHFYLGRVTGTEFSATDDTTDAGILLRRADDAPAKAVDLLPLPSQEACCLWPEGDRLWIVGRSDTALCHAVYLYLEQLGCRWYAPSDKWTIVPRRDDIRLKESLAAQPEFRSRLFSGTGGFGGALPLDQNRQLEARWMHWQRRNRFGGEFRLSGHSGEAFNVKHRKQLEQHPEWRAMIDGKRVPWSLTAKFCAGNPEVVALYVQDRLDIYRQLRKRAPEDPRAWAVSVDPADGGGHCTAPESLAIGSVSDRVFHVANEVARAMRKEFPDGRVSLFGYNKHAAVPSIPLEPNVYVQVIPYAFQRTGLTPDQLLDAWSRKVSRMGVYDYWSIPDWSHDLPTFDPLVFGPTRLRDWHRRGVDSFLCESTFSSGAMGPAWYIAARVAWQSDADADRLFTEMMHGCFGVATEPMERMLRRWSLGFYLTSHELALSFRDVDEAWRLAGQDKDAAARVADYGRYVEYLRHRFEYLQTKRASAERRAAADRLMRYLWSIYDSTMIHAFRHSQLLARDERIAGDATLSEVFDWRDKAAPGWSSIRAVTDEQVRKRVRTAVEELKPQAFVARRFKGPLTLATRQTTPSSSDDYTPVLWLNNSLEFHIQADHDGQVFRPRIAAQLPVRLLVTDPNGNQLADHSVETGESWRTAWSNPELTLPKPGLYRIEIVAQRRTFRLSLPAKIPLTMTGWSNSQGTPTPRLYFYVPKGTEQLAVYANYVAAGPPRFFDPVGNEIQPTLVDNGHLQIVPIPARQRGKIWSLDRAKCPIGPMRFLNGPAAFALSPGTLMVPSDALAE